MKELVRARAEVCPTYCCRRWKTNWQQSGRRKLDWRDKEKLKFSNCLRLDNWKTSASLSLQSFRNGESHDEDSWQGTESWKSESGDRSFCPYCTSDEFPEEGLGVEVVSHSGDGHQPPPDGVYEGPGVTGVSDQVGPGQGGLCLSPPVGAVQTWEPTQLSS